jgi:hypothetical protein
MFASAARNNTMCVATTMMDGAATLEAKQKQYCNLVEKNSRQA